MLLGRVSTTRERYDMYVKRIVGAFLILSLTFELEPVSYAQEGLDSAASQALNPEQDENTTPRGDGVNAEQLAFDISERDSEPELRESLTEENVENNDSQFLESIGMSIADFENTQVTDEQLASLSDVDLQDLEAANLLKVEISGKEISEEEFTNEVEDLVSDDCFTSRFMACSSLNFWYRSYVPTQGGRTIGTRSFILHVRNEMTSNNTKVVAEPIVKFIEETGRVRDTTLRFALVDQNRDRTPISDQFTLKTDLLREQGTVKLERLELDLPVAETTREKYIVIQGATVWNWGLYPIRGYAGDGAVMRCGRAWDNATKNCVNPHYRPTIVFDGNGDFEHVAQNIHTAITKENQPSVLTRDPSQVRANRYAACRRTNQQRLEKLGKKPDGMPTASCDEYPFASTKEGGDEARVQWVPREENNKQGHEIKKFLEQNQLQPEDRFEVKAILKQ